MRGVVSARQESCHGVNNGFMEEKRTYGIANTPGSDGNTLGIEETGLEGNRIVDRGGSGNIEFSDGDVNIGRSQRADCRDGSTSSTSLRRSQNQCKAEG